MGQLHHVFLHGDKLFLCTSEELKQHKVNFETFKVECESVI
jgi:hypothetical protein